MTLKELIKEKGYTNNSLARKAKVGQATVCELSNGGRKSVRLSTILKLAKALNVDLNIINDCIGGESNANKTSNC